MTFQPSWSSTPFDQSFIGIPNQDNVKISHQRYPNGTIVLQVSINHYEIRQVYENNRLWNWIDLSGETRKWEVGAPQVPVIARAIRLPNTGKVSWNILSQQYEWLNDILLYPQQEMSIETEKGIEQPNSFIVNEQIYQTDQFYPLETILLGQPAILRDARIALLGIQPLQYNPVTKVAKLLTYLELEIVPVGGTGENEIHHPPKPVPSFAALYRDVIGAEDLVLDNASAPPGQILIISKNYTTNRNAIQPLLDWKNRTGYPIQLQTPTGSSITVQTIQNIINNAFTTFNPPLEFVILVGDGGPQGQTFMPTYFVNQVATDHPYGQLVGNDILADVSIGRFSIANVNQLQLMVNRTIMYEKANETDTTWYKKGWGYAGISHGVLSNRAAIQFCNEMMRNRGITTTYYDEHNGLISTTLLTQRLTPGALFWAHRAAWVGEISVNDISTINNINKPFVAVNITCGSGNWYDTDTGIHEALTRLGTPTAPAGALAGLSTATPNTHPAFNNVVTTGVFYGLGVLKARQFGTMVLSGKFQLWRNFNLSLPDQVNNFSYWNNTMGDISANLWTNVPKIITMNAPDTITTYTNSLSLTVNHQNQPIPNVLVTVYKKNSTGATEIYQRQITNESGQVTFTFSNPTIGTMYISAVGIHPNDNWKPYVDSMIVYQPQLGLALNSILIDDDNQNGTVGNGNQSPNPNETIDINFNLINNGNVPINAFTATLSTLNASITVLNPTQNYPSIAVGANASAQAPFRVIIPPYLPENHLNLLTLTFQSNPMMDPITIPLIIRSIKTAFDSLQIFPSTNWDVGSTVQFAANFRNIGGLSLNSSITGTLSTSSRYVTVVQPVATFQTFPNSGTITNSVTQRWQVHSSLATPRGAVIPFQVLFSNGSVSDTLRFTATVGTPTMYDVVGPDAYGYYAYENMDTAYSAHPNFNWIEIIPAYGGQGTRLTIFDYAYNQDSSVVMRLPFPVRFYGNTYDSITISSNGWAALGAQRSYNNFRNWRLPAPEGPRSIIAPFWCDLFFNGTEQGVFTYFDAVNHQLIITWNVTTLHGGQALNQFQLILFDYNYWRTPTNDTQILFQYKNFNNVHGDDNDVDFATIGISDETRTRALELSFMNQYATGMAAIQNGYNVNRAILFTTQIPDSLLRWIAPNDRDTLAIGFPETLVWTGRPSLQTVNIDINRNYPSPFWQRIVTNIANTGSIQWNVSGPATYRARLRIISNDGLDGDTTKTNLIIQIPQPTLELFYPIGNERLPYNVPTMISWGTSQLPGGVAIELNRNYPNEEWQVLYPNLPAQNGSVVWTPTSPISSRARIRIRSLLFPNVADTSNQEFSIVAPAYLVITPNPITATVPPNDSLITNLTIANFGDAPFEGDLIPFTGLEGYNYMTSLQPYGPAFSWANSTLGVNGPTGDGVNAGPFLMPFSFPLYDQTFDTIYMNTNGWFTFNNPSGITSGANQQLPYSIMRTFFAVYWDDLITTQGQTKVFLDSINQKVVLSWNNVRKANENQSSLTFQAILTPDGVIQYNYLNLNCIDTTVTVGLQNYNHSAFFNVFYRVRVPDSTSVRFDTYHRWATPNRTIFSIPAGATEHIQVAWNATNRVLNQVIQGTFRFTGNAENTPLDVPVWLNVGYNLNDSSVELPQSIILQQNYPNPFNVSTNIRFVVSKETNVHLSVFNIFGEEVATLINQKMSAGIYVVHFNAKDFASGIYILQLHDGTQAYTRKMVLVK
ncbi:MAG: C25 family cysteine peptidase [bacterium]|nr:C25 family cysteine peptidase [bacterium]